MTPVVSFRNLGHAYGAHIAVRNVDFDIMPQSIHGFVGPNGAGKTTTLKILATLIKPQRGSVTVFGMNVVGDYKKVRTRIGYMQDHFSMYRQMTVFEYLDFFGAAYGMSVSQRNKTILDILELTDMSGRRDNLIRGLSRGMQQRVTLARALVHDPDLLLLDEPASGLDPRARIELMDILRALRDLGKTIFISSHILSELAELCDHVTIVDRGTVKYTGTMDGLISTSQGETRTYRLILGEPAPELARHLETVAGVRFVEREEEAAEHPYLITIGKDETTPNLLLSAVLTQPVTVLGFAESKRHLNDAFMELTEAGVRS